MASKKLTISVRSHIKYEDIENLLYSAGSGASYWAESELAYESEVKKIMEGGKSKIIDLEGGRTFHLTLQGIKRGLTVMAKKEIRHFADFLKEDGDDVTADVFLQCCLFGEVIYG